MTRPRRDASSSTPRTPGRPARVGCTGLARRADYYVCCQHWVSGRSRSREPHGVLHARRIGDDMTACGLFAMDWPMYFDRPITQEDPPTCDTCARSDAVRGEADQ